VSLFERLVVGVGEAMKLVRRCPYCNTRCGGAVGDPIPDGWTQAKGSVPWTLLYAGRKDVVCPDCKPYYDRVSRPPAHLL